jgi:hypothetical protein
VELVFLDFWYSPATFGAESTLGYKASPGERKQTAQQDFRYWFKSATEFLIDFGNAFERGSYTNAAFYLHQATERLYMTALLVFTHYKPKEHDIETLGKQVNNLDHRFLPIFHAQHRKRSGYLSYYRKHT